MSTALERLVERTYFQGIVFNQSWEDPEMDRGVAYCAGTRRRIVHNFRGLQLP